MGLDNDFPVHERNVPRVRVPVARLEEWKEVAQDEIMRALSHRHSWYNAFKDRVRDGFDMIADRPNLKAFVRPVPNTSDKDILIRSTLEGVHLDELVAGMYCDTTYDVRCAFAHLYEANFLDGAIVQSHETRTDEDPLHFVGVRWIAFRSPAPAIMTSRDFLYFSYEGTAYDVDGNRVLFRFLRSMPMDGIEVDKSMLPPLVTGKISNLHLYRQNGSRVDAFSKAMHSNAGNMPAWVVTKTITFMFPGIANIETICDARALLANGTAKLNPGRQRPLGSSSSSSGSIRGSSHSTMGHVAALASANACGVCFHKFKLTRAKRRCQGCTREVCKRCTKRMFFFDELKQISDSGVVALRFCLNCTRQARTDIRESNAQQQQQRASFSTRRSSGSASSSSRLHLQQQQQQQQQPSHHQHQQHQLVRRVPSGHGRFQPELEPPYADSSTHSYDHDDSDDESVSYNGYNGYDANTLLTTSAANFHHHQPQPPTSAPVPLQAHQIQQLQMLQQQRHYDPKDHEEFLRLYGEYATRHQQQQQQGKLISIEQLARSQHGPVPPPLSQPAQPPPLHHPPKPFRRQNSGGVSWNHSGGVGDQFAGTGHGHSHRSQSTMHTMPDMVPRHMIPPMPQADGPAARSQMIPLHINNGASATARTSSAPNLLAIDGNANPRIPHHHQHHHHHQHARAPPPAPPQESGAASEDLETIFRLRMMLFNGNSEADTETMSTTSSSSSHRTAAQRKALPSGSEPVHRSVQPLAQRY